MESVIATSCIDCPARPDRLFCDLSPDALQAFDEIKTMSQMARGTTLFREGQAARAMFVLCEGKARLSVCSEAGKRMTLRVAGPGEALGLTASLSNSPYEVTAELLEDGRVATVKRKDLLRFLREHRDACRQVVDLLSEDLHAAYDRVRSIGLGRTRRVRVNRVH